MSCTLHTNKKFELQAVHNPATMSGLNTSTQCTIPQIIGTALSTQKQKLHNSSDIPDMRYLENLSANSSGKKTTLYFNHRYISLQNKTAFVV